MSYDQKLSSPLSQRGHAYTKHAQQNVRFYSKELTEACILPLFRCILDDKFGASPSRQHSQTLVHTDSRHVVIVSALEVNQKCNEMQLRHSVLKKPMTGGRSIVHNPYLEDYQHLPLCERSQLIHHEGVASRCQVHSTERVTTTCTYTCSVQRGSALSNRCHVSLDSTLLKTENIVESTYNCQIRLRRSPCPG